MQSEKHNTLWKTVEEFHRTSPLTQGARDSAKEKKLLTDFISKVNIEELFLLLDQASINHQDDQVKTLCDVLRRMLEGQIGEEIMSKPEMEPFLIQGLSHREEEVQLLTMTKLRNYYSTLSLDSSSRLSYLINSDNLLAAIFGSMTSENITVSDYAVHVLTQVASAIDAGGHSRIVEILHENLSSSIIQQNSIAYARYLGLVAQICGISNTTFRVCKQKGVFQHLITALHTDDILLKLNVLEILGSASKSEDAVLHMFQCGIVEKVVQLCDDEQGGVDPLVRTNALRLVGELTGSAGNLAGLSWSQIDSQIAVNFLTSAMQHSDSRIETSQIAAFESIAAFCNASVEALQMVMNHQVLLRSWLECCSGSNLAVKANCLHSLADVFAKGTPVQYLWNIKNQPPKYSDTCSFSQSKEQPEDSKRWELHQQLFEFMGTCNNKDTMQLLMTYFKQPFPELRNASFNVLRTIASQKSSWGISRMLSYAGFMEFLLNNVEESKEGMEWRFSILDALVASPHLGILDKELQDKVKSSFQNGPYRKRQITQPELDAL